MRHDGCDEVALAAYTLPPPILSSSFPNIWVAGCKPKTPQTCRRRLAAFVGSLLPRLVHFFPATSILLPYR